jgi:pimeloyl-ACP methyl ester carboxylesterase
LKSQFYAVRKQILDDAVNELRALLKENRYRRILVVGHSLGSVIGFDALNRISHEMNTGGIAPNLASRITGFITFGSPLDKIAFFFREHTPDDEYLRRQILTHYHSFKARPLSEQHNPKEISNPFTGYLDHVHWVNFWDAQDKVSGQLDFYRVDENVQLRMNKGELNAHNGYWEYIGMYQKIVSRFSLP